MKSRRSVYAFFFIAAGVALACFAAYYSSLFFEDSVTITARYTGEVELTGMSKNLHVLINLGCIMTASLVFFLAGMKLSKIKNEKNDE